MDQITEKMQALMSVEWAYLSKDMTEAASQLKKANEHIEALSKKISLALVRIPRRL
jgi:hypothetical protein